jgi:hypothetical protein
MAKSTASSRILGSERPIVEGATLLGPVETTERVIATLLLRQKPGQPDPPDLQHWQDNSPEKRSFLSPEDFYARHGAAQEEMDAVLEYLNEKGLRIVEKHTGQRRIVVEGSAAEIDNAFGIHLNRYRAPERFPRGEHHEPKEKDEKAKDRKEGRPFGQGGRIEEHVYRGFEGHVHLPAPLAEIVVAVIGLDNRQLSIPAGNGTGDPAGAAYLSPATIAQRYNFPTNKATGQTIGIFEAADGGAAYLHSDVTSFIENLPDGATLPLPVLNDISLLGHVNNPALVTIPVTGGAFECNIDVSIAAASGLGSNINVYFTSGSEAGWEAFFNRSIFPPAGDNPPSVLTASWVPWLGDDASKVGLLSNPGSPVSIFHAYLTFAALRGITVFMALGDWGANNLYGGVKCHVSYPNCDPFVTACGGTIMGEANATPPPAFDEWTWSDANLPSPWNGGPPPPIYNATGGGVSDTFPLPPFQVAAGILPISKNDGNIRRGVPDVAGMVAMSGFFIKGSGGFAGYGTSAVAPLYAGLVATINAFLGRNVGFLNPTLYIHGPEICNDIVVGNNDSGNTPDSPFYTADIGWDPCTGWGSINGLRLLAALAPAPILATLIADHGAFGTTCPGSFVDKPLTLVNSGFSTLLIWGISSSSAAFEVPSVVSYPLAIAPGESLEVPLRFQPTTAGFDAAKISIFSNDLFNPHVIEVTGTGQAPRLALMIPDHGNFGNVCIGSFADESLILNNSGKCALTVTNISSSSAVFLVPEVLSYPLTINAGGFLPVPIRFQPTAFGAASATITVTSDNPLGPLTVDVSGDAPSGKLAVTGSTCFGGVKACCCADRTISVCNVGDCSLNVTSVRFRRKSHHWKLLHNPFPAKLHPGSSLSVVIQYKATEKCPRACELIIETDDPLKPVLVLDVLAYTIWNDCGCKDDCGCGCKGGSEKHEGHHGCSQGYDCCCDDDCEDDKD